MSKMPRYTGIAILFSAVSSAIFYLGSTFNTTVTNFSNILTDVSNTSKAVDIIPSFVISADQVRTAVYTPEKPLKITHTPHIGEDSNTLSLPPLPEATLETSHDCWGYQNKRCALTYITENSHELIPHLNFHSTEKIPSETVKDCINTTLSGISGAEYIHTSDAPNNLTASLHIDNILQGETLALAIINEYQENAYLSITHSFSPNFNEEIFKFATITTRMPIGASSNPIKYEAAIFYDYTEKGWNASKSGNFDGENFPEEHKDLSITIHKRLKNFTNGLAVNFITCANPSINPQRLHKQLTSLAPSPPKPS